MKKFLKGFGIFFFSFGFIVYTIMFFTEAPELRPVFIIMDVIMGFFLFLLLRKRKPKQTVRESLPSNRETSSPCRWADRESPISFPRRMASGMEQTGSASRIR